jgi:agmatinase
MYMTKNEKIEAFDPNGYATNDSLFGLPFNQDEADVWVLPVPWEVTVSYATGTAQAPAAIREASLQVDLYDPFVKDSWKSGIYMSKVSELLLNKSEQYRSLAEDYLDTLFAGNPDINTLAKINSTCEEMIKWVEEQATSALQQNKKLVLLGGDHSTPLGYMLALAKKHDAFGILQIDAHADLREAYEGFTYSHASIMYNALKLDSVKALVQVGIRDYCESEFSIIENDDRVHTFFDRDIKQRSFEGTHWGNECASIVAKLPQHVYISFDIDGLDPKLCPNTGTPVSGGFEAEQVLFLFEKVVESGRTIIGIDLNEVGTSPNTDWDANVAARLLYRLCNLMLVNV